MPPSLHLVLALVLLGVAHPGLAAPMFNPSDVGITAASKLSRQGSSAAEQAGPDRPRIVFRFKAPPRSTSEEPLRTISTASSSSGSSAAGEVTSGVKTLAEHRRSFSTSVQPGRPPGFKEQQAVYDRVKAAWLPSVPWTALRKDTLQALHGASDEQFRRVMARKLHKSLDRAEVTNEAAVRAEIRAKFGGRKGESLDPHQRRVPRRGDGEAPRLQPKTLERIAAIVDPAEREAARRIAVNRALESRARSRTKMAERNRAERSEIREGWPREVTLGAERDHSVLPPGKASAPPPLRFPSGLEGDASGLGGASRPTFPQAIEPLRALPSPSHSSSSSERTVHDF